jgi:hypothetical protein
VLPPAADRRSAGEEWRPPEALPIERVLALLG